MIADLALELLRDVVEGRQDVGSLRVGAEGSAGREQRGLDHGVPVRRLRMMLGDELELQTGHARLQARQPGQLVLGLLPDLIGDR